MLGNGKNIDNVETQNEIVRTKIITMHINIVM
jgi:hypothetical protein